MPNQHDTVEQRLEKISVEKLSTEERESLWNAVKEAHAKTPRAVPSPYVWMLSVHSRMAVSVALLLIVVVGGGTVTIADTAKPGDVLYGLDRATEHLRFVLSSNDNKPSVQLAFTHERLSELDDIISEETAKQDTAPIETMSKKEELSEQNVADIAAESVPVETMRMVAQDTGAVPIQSDMSPESAEKIAVGVENAIATLEDVAVSLKEGGDEETREGVVEAVNHLERKLITLPESDQKRFRSRIEKVRERGERSVSEPSADGNVEDTSSVPNIVGFEDAPALFSNLVAHITQHQDQIAPGSALYEIKLLRYREVVWHDNCFRWATVPMPDCVSGEYPGYIVVVDVDGEEQVWTLDDAGVVHGTLSEWPDATDAEETP